MLFAYRCRAFYLEFGQAVVILMSQKDSGFKITPLLKALRSAAVMALPPKAAADGDGDGDGGGGGDGGGTDADDMVRQKKTA